MKTQTKNINLALASLGWITLIFCLLILTQSCCKQVTESTSSISTDSVKHFKEIKDTTICFKPITNYHIIPKSTGDTSYSTLTDDSLSTTITNISKKDGTVVIKTIVKPKPITITKYKEVIIEKKAKEVTKTIVKKVEVPTRPWYFIPTIIIAILIGIFTQRLFNVTAILRKLFTGFL